MTVARRTPGLRLKSELNRNRAVDLIKLGWGEVTEPFRDAVYGNGSNLVGDGA